MMNVDRESGNISLGVIAPVIAAIIGGGVAIFTAANVVSKAPEISKVGNNTSGQIDPANEVPYGTEGPSAP